MEEIFDTEINENDQTPIADGYYISDDYLIEIKGNLMWLDEPLTEKTKTSYSGSYKAVGDGTYVANIKGDVYPLNVEDNKIWFDKRWYKSKS